MDTLTEVMLDAFIVTICAIIGIPWLGVIAALSTAVGSIIDEVRKDDE